MDMSIWHEAFRILTHDVPEFVYPERLVSGGEHRGSGKSK
jgi:hypothetical protein